VSSLFLFLVSVLGLFLSLGCCGFGFFFFIVSLPQQKGPGLATRAFRTS
jgi:hypothetical protein